MVFDAVGVRGHWRSMPSRCFSCVLHQNGVLVFGCVRVFVLVVLVQSGRATLVLCVKKGAVRGWLCWSGALY